MSPWIDPRRKPWAAGTLLGAAHALCWWLAFPPMNLAGLALAGMAALCWAAWRTERPLASALAASATAVPMWLAHHAWMWDVSAAGLPVLALYMSLYAGLFVWVMARARRWPALGETWRWWAAAAVAWVGVEALRGLVVWHGYPWYLLGHPMIDAEPLAGWAPAFGVYGVSLACAAVVCAALAPGRWSARGVAARLGVIVGVAGGGLACWALWAGPGAKGGNSGGAGGGVEDGGVEAGRPVVVGLVQTSVPQDNRAVWTFAQRTADFARFAALTREAASRRPAPDVIVWPETMFPGLALQADAVAVERAAGLTYAGGEPSTVFIDGLLALQREVGAPMLVGGIGYEGLRIGVTEEGAVEVTEDARFNSVFVVRGGAVEERRYDKVSLTPFGEYMPYISWSDWLEARLLALGATGMRFDLRAGERLEPLEVALADGRVWRAATPVCFEVTMPWVCRRMVFAGGVRRASAMVNLTNDGWFAEHQGGRSTHMLLSRWRAVELATPVARAANTGLSVVIDARGRVVEPGPGPNAEGVVVAAMPAAGGVTPYARVGDALGWASLAGLGVIFAGAVARGGRRGNERAAAAGAAPGATRG